MRNIGQVYFSSDMDKPSSNFNAPMIVHCNKAMEGFFFSLYAILALAAFLGNLLTYIVFLSKKRLREIYMNVLLISLAISDFLMSILVLPGFVMICFSCTTSLLSRHHPTCLSLEAIKDYVLLVNMFNVLCITFDRYVAVFQPFRYSTKMNKTSLTVLLVSAWILPFPIAYIRQLLVLISPDVFQIETNRSICDIIVGIVCVVLPICTIAIVNSLIIKVIRKQMKQIHRQRSNQTLSFQNKVYVSSDTTSIVEASHAVSPNILESQNDKSSVAMPDAKYDKMNEQTNYAIETGDTQPAGHLNKVNDKEDNFQDTFDEHGSTALDQPRPPLSVTKKLKKFSRLVLESSGTRSCLAVSVVVVISWVPWFLFNVLRMVLSRNALNAVNLLEKISLLFFYFQSSLNPLVYSLCRKDFRQAAKDLFKNC